MGTKKWDLVIGSKVRIKGLVKAAKHNGKTAVVTKLRAPGVGTRVAVRLEDGSGAVLAIKVENLEILSTPSVGSLERTLEYLWSLEQLPSPPMSTPKDCFESLPDDLVVHVGISVALWAGLIEFARLSKTCKRLCRLLAGRPETVERVLEHGTNSFRETVKVPKRYRLEGYDAAKKTNQQSELPRFWTLAQLALYETVKRFGMLHNNIIRFENIQDEGDLYKIVLSARFVMNKYPEAILQIDAHCGTDGDEFIAFEMSNAIAEAACNGVFDPKVNRVGDYENHPIKKKKMQRAFQSVARHRTLIRSWGQVVSTTVPSEHDHKALARKGWVEFSFRMKGPPGLPEFTSEIVQHKDGYWTSAKVLSSLRVPSRPDYYRLWDRNNRDMYSRIEVPYETLGQVSTITQFVCRQELGRSASSHDHLFRDGG